MARKKKKYKYILKALICIPECLWIKAYVFKEQILLHYVQNTES